MPEDRSFRPIKVVIPRDEDYQKKGGGGGKKTLFDAFGLDLQTRLGEDTEKVFDHFEQSFSQWPDIPAVARVRLRPKAIAKSHRPANFFKNARCPIIGNQEIGALLIRVTPGSLESLRHQIMYPASHDDQAQISTMTKIEAYSDEYALGTQTLNHLVTQIGQGLSKLKLRIFNHLDQTINYKVQTRLRDIIDDLGLSAERLDYPWGLDIYRITNLNPDAIDQLSRFVGTQHLGLFPQLGMVTKASVSVRPAKQEEFPPPVIGAEYPLVGVIDSGVRLDDQLLGPWLHKSEEYVAGKDFAPDHGTFVCSLIINPRILNHDDARFPGEGAKIVSVAAVPKGGIHEDDLLYIIEQSLVNYPEVKIWNLSVSDSSTICRDDGFSSMAMKLDELQDRFGVNFVVPSGNYATPPLRSWPVLSTEEAERIGENDRITSPADSVRSLTVGSIAHVNAAIGLS